MSKKKYFKNWTKKNILGMLKQKTPEKNSLKCCLNNCAGIKEKIVFYEKTTNKPYFFKGCDKNAEHWFNEKPIEMKKINISSKKPKTKIEIEMNKYINDLEKLSKEEKNKLLKKIYRINRIIKILSSNFLIDENEFVNNEENPKTFFNDLYFKRNKNIKFEEVSTNDFFGGYRDKAQLIIERIKEKTKKFQDKKNKNIINSKTFNLIIFDFSTYFERLFIEADLKKTNRLTGTFNGLALNFYEMSIKLKEEFENNKYINRLMLITNSYGKYLNVSNIINDNNNLPETLMQIIEFNKENPNFIFNTFKYLKISKKNYDSLFMSNIKFEFVTFDILFECYLIKINIFYLEILKNKNIKTKEFNLFNYIFNNYKNIWKIIFDF